MKHKKLIFKTVTLLFLNASCGDNPKEKFKNTKKLKQIIHPAQNQKTQSKKKARTVKRTK